MSDDQRKSEIPEEKLVAIANLSDDELWVATCEQILAEVQARMSKRAEIL